MAECPECFQQGMVGIFAIGQPTREKLVTSASLLVTRSLLLDTTSNKKLLVAKGIATNEAIGRDSNGALALLVALKLHRQGAKKH